MIKKIRRSDRVIEFIEKYCHVPEGMLVGQPINLLIFQRKFIRAIYDNPHGTKRAYLSMGRKNGKTALIAAILLAHLVGPEAKLNSQIVSGALSRDQAAQVFNYASKIISLSPKLRDLVKIIPSNKRLIGLPLNVEYKALAAEAKTAHGLSPILAILDEMGQVKGPKSEFVSAITTAQGAHKDPLLIVISTQAENDNDLFSRWLDDAQQSKDPKIVSHLYTARENADLIDEVAWKVANPALGVFRSIDDVRQQAIQAERMPADENEFRNFVLNQRVVKLSPFISKNVWEAGNKDVLEFDDVPVWGGLDLSSHTDLTAFVMIGEVNNIWQVKAYFWTPFKNLEERERQDKVPYSQWVKEGFLLTTPGATVEYKQVATDIFNIVSNLNLKAIAYDRYGMKFFNDQLDQLGFELPLIEHGQGFKDMPPAIKALEAELLNKRLSHGGHPVLKMCAANAKVTLDPAGNKKFDKKNYTARIDGIVALAMAFGGRLLWTEQENKKPPPPKYQIHFV